MAKGKFIPRRDGDLNMYEGNLVSKLELHKEELGLDPVLVEEIITGINRHRDSFSEMISKRAESKSATEKHDMERKNAVRDIRRIAKIVKSMKNYNAAIGDNLQIIGSEHSPEDLSQIEPVLKAKVSGGNVTITYKKMGTAIKLFSKKQDEDAFSELVITTKNSYVDTRPKIDAGKPESREYYAIYLDDMIGIGLKSGIIKVVIW